MKKKMLFIGLGLLVALFGLAAWVPQADASSSYYSSRGCAGCHGSSPNTCAGCHAHGTHSSSSKNNLNITGTTNKASYSPGETVSVTIDGDYRSGWVRAILYDQNMNELARSTGTVVDPAIAPSGAPSLPVTLSAPAPMTPGTYNWNVSWYGNEYDSGSGFFGPRWTPDPDNEGHGEEIVSTNAFTVESLTPPFKQGIYQNGMWYLDANGNGAWNGGSPDALYSFGFPGASAVTGDWDGDGLTEVGVFDGGIWYLDTNGNGIWDGPPTDGLFVFGGGLSGAVPVTGDWDGDGITDIAVFVDGMWYLDLNGNRSWDDTPSDGLYSFGTGLTGAIPVAGDWDASGAAEIGIFHDGIWYLDVDGSGTWDGEPTDARYVFGSGIAGAMPVTGDWNATGTTKLGIYVNGTWYLDINGDGQWNGTPTDTLSTFGGLSGAEPVSGKW